MPSCMREESNYVYYQLGGHQIQVIIIDEEFRGLLPALDGETFRSLEKNLLEHGCRDPLVLWNGILIDGYNRYKICMDHNIPFSTVDKEFNSREEVLIWIISNQVSRRNLTPIQLSHFRGLHYEADKKMQGTNNRFAQQSKKSQNETFYSGSTANRLADQYNVSRNTIIRNAKLSEAIKSIGEVSPEAKRKILSGEIRINNNKLEALSSASGEEIEALATKIEDGSYERVAPGTGKKSGGEASSPEGETTESAGRVSVPEGETIESAGRVSVPEGETMGHAPTLMEVGIASDSIHPEIRQFNALIRYFTSNFNAMFQQRNNDVTVELKSALRSYIDQLEDLYRNI